MWSIAGSIFILSATASIVYIDVQINKWFGEFYDVLQKALSELDLEFSSKELALEYAKKNKIQLEIIEPKKRKIVKKSYSDNFLK